jgi:hypothetical protein
MDGFLESLKDSMSDERCCLIGIGIGECKLVHVGGVFLRQEFFPAGTAIDESLDALQLADSMLGLIVSKTFHEEFNSSNLPTHLELVIE